MDDSISFGDVEESQPDVAQRPDQNYHYAVVSVGEVAEIDLPIFIDIDTALDIETHALEDTDIELGGVLLGGQYTDDQGNAFVLVRDSLRAENYEATKSSFKFTHETWEKISRQRDKFPEGTEIVGWYHTHPDWGVFLSGMDMFICNGFFNRPLDVALVVDPCREERGWFHWSPAEDAPQKRQTSGFYLFGSRFRLEELQLTAEAMISKESRSMVTQQRIATNSGSTPVVHIHQPDQKWLGLAIFWMIFMQSCLLLAVAFLFLMGGSQNSMGSRQADQRIYESLISKLLSDKAAGEDPEATVKKLVDAEAERQFYEARLETMTLGAEELSRLRTTLANRLKFEQQTTASLKEENKEADEKIKQLNAYKVQVEAAEKGHLIAWWTNWVNLVLVGLAAVGVFVGGLFVAGLWRPDYEDDHDSDMDSPSPPSVQSPVTFEE